MSRKPTNAAAEPPGTPSDLELMLYADGELPEERIAEVEAYLDRSASARNKLRGLDLVSTLIREDALDRAAQAGDLTDAIFARIQAEAPAVAPAPAPK